jgi:hypothetical protein
MSSAALTPTDFPVLFARLRSVVEPRVNPLAAPWPSFVLFFSWSDGQRRANVVSAAARTFVQAWDVGMERVSQAAGATGVDVQWLRVDWVENGEVTTWESLRNRLAQSKRNYFRCGLSLDKDFKHAFLETELNANAMLYGGAAHAHAVVNTKNFERYATIRHQVANVDFSDAREVYVFSACGAFTSLQSQEVHLLHGTGLNAGRRLIEQLQPADVRSLVATSSRYLAGQVQQGGRFHYGRHPCFDRVIGAYNTLRHASSVYAMLEAWEVTQDNELKIAIDAALHYLVNELIKSVELPSGVRAAFLVDAHAEIKLGGNGVCLLALVKYSQLTGSDEYLTLLEQLATGILFMQDADIGKFSHVLNFPELSVKQDFRIIYYDGEAAFGLMRLYGLTRDARWLEAVEKAFGYFIEAKHWNAHDHWLSYCVNELTRYKPLEAYYKFGIQNVAGYLDFVLERITTFPTLLELTMAAEQMISRLRQHAELNHLLADLDLDKFYRAMHTRAHYLLNGHFWPELAMFFANPSGIVGSFFIRHHAFRVRIDDVEHYLSGFVAYLNYLESGRASGSSKKAPSVAPSSIEAKTFKDKPISIGMMRAGGKPGPVAVANAHAAAMQGARLYFFTPDDVDLQARKIGALHYHNGSWKPEKISYPDVIENDEASRYKDAWSSLTSNIPITTHVLGGKFEVFRRMRSAGLYDDLLIPGDVIRNFPDFLADLYKFEKSVVKPAQGSMGREIFYFESRSDGFMANLGGKTEILSERDLRSFYEANIRRKTFILQKYIESKTEQGLPFDVRLHVRRDHLAQWKTVKIYVRIGAGKTVASNLSAGGSIASPRSFLDGKFGGQGVEIWNRLRTLAEEFPVRFQHLFPDYMLDALGIDL